MRLILLVALLFGGCAHKASVTKPSLIIFKSKQFRYADSGFVRRSGGGVVVEIYNAAQPLLRLRLFKRVCMKDRCMSYEQFNRHFLSPFYPPRLIQQVFLARPIFAGENLIEESDGFVQKIKDNHLDIIYQVQDGTIYFKDRKNHILIKIKEFDG